MFSHALHSPNLSNAELHAYLSSRLPPRDRHSLVEVAEHDPHLLKFLTTPLNARLVQELIKTTERVIRIPSDSLTPGAPLSPPVTPVKASAAKSGPVPVHLSSRWKPLDQFVVRLIEASNVRVPTLSYALIVLDRLKDKLPPLAQGMQCTRHRIFLAALVVASKYLNDSTPKNKHWALYARGLFDTCEITLMEKQMLGLLDFDLRITEADLAARLAPLIYANSKPRGRQDAVKAQASLKPPQPCTPITPITPSNSHPTSSAPVHRVDEGNARKSNSSDQAFVLQPVPALKKRSEKAAGSAKMPQRGTSLSSSQSAPLQTVAAQEEKVVPKVQEAATKRPILAIPELPLPKLTIDLQDEKLVTSFRGSVAMPLARSFSSDGLLEGAGSMAMYSARTFSSNASNMSSSMTSSSSISVSTSTSHSEVGTPGDRHPVWVAESASQHYFQAHPTGEDLGKAIRLRRRGSESATGSAAFPTFMVRGPTDGPSKDNGLMNKLMGVGKNLSPARRIGHGVKGDRKVSTATIVPDEISIEN